MSNSDESKPGSKIRWYWSLGHASCEGFIIAFVSKLADEDTKISFKFTIIWTSIEKRRSPIVGVT